ncbi:unnamed protein product [Rotaria magnacalcarata]|uniref:RING-type domain-containing protein n=1 Tax=Rotaria magnacalcarata TaxID=392030 RepID=A0A816XUL4_9BILA|nr:unnamed protein product [Rotaria magnacalcarata]CAF4039302.1 unnamed protein product [Rotaria magnacalcarata]
MRTIIEADIFHVCTSLGAINQLECTTTTTTLIGRRDISPHRTRSNSNSSEPASILSDDVFMPSSPSSASLLLPSSTSSSEISDQNLLDHDDDNSSCSLEFIYPTDSEDESSYVYDNDNNDELYLQKHVSKQQFVAIESLQKEPYQRSKRSKKKMNAQRQIKTKHAKSIKIKSHNKCLYIHHRLAKKIILDEPSYKYIRSSEPVPLYSCEALRSIVHQHRHSYDSSYTYYSTSFSKVRKTKPNNNIFVDESQTNLAAYLFPDYTLHEYNIPDEPSFDEDMVEFLLEMQNRDLSPEDYEMLLRLDERVKRKTLNTNILNTLPTIDVIDMHLAEQCTICMEKYQHEQKLKLLPCKHIFHLHCIETYLKEFSNQCPLDNLPLV